MLPSILIVHLPAARTEQVTETFKRVFIIVLNEGQYTLMHNIFRNNARLVQLADKGDVAQHFLPGHELHILLLFLHRGGTEKKAGSAFSSTTRCAQVLARQYQPTDLVHLLVL